MEYKVLVVEDEPPILANIVRKIDALGLPVSVVATAMDGEEALGQIARCQPQIVFTDIRMSGMDGLTLCAKISEEYPQIKTVVISGYGEFEYAQRAIKCKVAGYLLKPVNAEELRKTLQGICAVLQAEGAQQQRQILVRHLEGGGAEPALPCQFSDEKFGVYLICLGNLLEHTLGDGGLPFYSALWAEADLSAVLDAILPAQSQWWLIGEKHPNEQILVTSAFLPPVGEALHRAIAVGLSGSVSVTVCACPQAVAYPDLWKTAQRLRHALHTALVPCTSRFFLCDSHTAFAEEGLDALLQLVLRAVQNRQGVPFAAGLGRYFAALQEQCAPQRYLELGVAHIVKALFEYSGLAPATPPGDLLNQLIAEGRSADGLYAALQQRLNSLFAQGFPSCVSGEALARTVKKYLEENYRKDISVHTLTDTFHFSASYIGRVFRDRYGVPPVKYLLQLRMEQAKKLLAQRTSVVLVAQMVGYEDPHYFSRLFRATAGVSPSEYKDSLCAK